MKKISAILLVLCMVMTFVMSPVYAAVGTEKNYALTKTENITNFALACYDHTLGEITGAEASTTMRQNTAEDRLESSRFQLNAGGEWIKLDLATYELPAGTYEVQLSYKSVGATTADFLVDDVLELRTHVTRPDDVTNNTVFGKVYIPEGAESLTVRNFGKNTFDFKNVKLVCVSEEDTSENIVFDGTASTYGYVSGAITYRLLTDYLDARCRAEDDNYIVPCNGECPNYTENTGYHHKTFTGMTLQPGGSWLRFDVSELAAGTYEVIMNTSARDGATAQLLVDDIEETEAIALDSKGADDFGDYYDQSLGKITLSAESEFLKLKNPSSKAFVAKALTFVPTEPDPDPLVITKDTEYTGFYSHDEDAEGPSVDNTYLNINPSGEWVSYDISSCEAGTYEVYVDYVSEADGSAKMRGLDLVVDGNLELRSYLDQKPTSESAEVGKVYLPEGAKELKIKNHGVYQIKVKTVLLNYVEEEDTSEDIAILAHNATSTYSVDSIPVESAEPIDVPTYSFVLGEDYYDYRCKAYNEDTGYTVACSSDFCAYHSETKGYHLAFTDGRTAGDALIVRARDWIRYDISDLKPGYYEVVADIRASAREGYDPVVAEIMLGNAKSAVVASSVITPVYEEIEVPAEEEGQEPTITKNQIFADATIGTIKVTEEDEYLILKSKSGGDYYELKSLTFKEYIPDETIIYYSSDAEGEEIIDTLDGLDTAYVTASIVRPRKLDSINETIIVALYDGKKLESVQTAPVTEGYEFEDTFEVTGIFDLNEPIIKVFVWDNLTGMNPVVENKEISVSYESQYLGEGFTRLSLKDASFEAGVERTFGVEIEEDGEYAIFLNQVNAAANSYGVSIEKDGEEITLCEMAAAENKSYNACYVRAGAVGSSASGSVSLTSGKWNLKIKALNAVDVSYVDIRSTVIPVSDEAIAVYPSDYNYYTKVGGNTFVNAEINYNTHFRLEGYSYFADYTNANLLAPFEYGRGILLAGDSSLHTYKLNAPEAGTYKVKAVFVALSGAEVTEEANNANVTLSMNVGDGEASSFTYTFEIGTVKNKSSEPMECEIDAEFAEGINELNFTLDGHRGYLKGLVIEPVAE